MHAILVKENQALVWGDVPEPVAKAGEILVEIHAAALNRADLMQRDGHVSVLPGERWILNDSYPSGQEFEKRVQPLYLYDREEDHRIELELCHSPVRYQGEFRCDLHPRSSPDGRFVTIDSTHDGRGRQVYLLDIEGITNR